MAWRVHDSVVRGEIDNRTKGLVRGKLWLHGWKEPVMLELAGNACPDLAGCLLKFTNPGKTFRLPKRPEFAPVQRGTVGELSASRKVRVFANPTRKARAKLDRGEQPPERMANALHLEWFSEANGRVVIESAEFELEISPPEWRLTAAEEKQRARDAAAGWERFQGRLNEAIDKQRRGQKDPEAEDWDEHDYERFLKESDARTTKYLELLEKYGDSDEAEEQIAKEMGLARELTPAEEERRRQWIEEMNAAAAEAMNEPEPAPDPQREGIDWIRTDDGDLAHPLEHRCQESAMKYWRAIRALGGDKLADEDVGEFVFEFQTTGAKLAGALGNIARDGGGRDAGFTVAYLKRALDHLHQSQAGLEAASRRKALPAKLVTAARRELFEIREGILGLMDEYRGRR